MLDDADREVLARYRAAKSPSADETAQALWRMQARLRSGPPPMELDEEDARGGGAVRWAVVAVAIAAVVALALSLDLGGVLSRQGDSGGAELEAPYVGERESADGYAAEGRRGAEDRGRSRRASGGGEGDSRAAGAADTGSDDEPGLGAELEPADATAFEGDDADAPEAADADTPEADADAPEAAPDTTGSGSAASSETDGTSVRRRPKPAPRGEPAPTPDATLAAEMALLREAQAAIAGGNPQLALEKIGHHARTFPRSQLAPERELARVRALCALGREADAEQAAKKFRKRFAGSHLDKRLDKTCVGEGDDP